MLISDSERRVKGKIKFNIKFKYVFNVPFGNAYKSFVEQSAANHLVEVVMTAWITFNNPCFFVVGTFESVNNNFSFFHN